jgi:hypothetical protein
VSSVYHFESDLFTFFSTLFWNAFLDDTPKGVKHYTLWSRYDLYHEEIIDFVDHWLSVNMPKARRWQYDDNCGERSFLIFHVHVFIETEPYSFRAREELEYFPPHMMDAFRRQEEEDRRRTEAEEGSR